MLFLLCRLSIRADSEIVLIMVVIGAVYTMQIMSQSDRLDFLPPDVAPAGSGAELRAVLHAV